MRLAAATLVPLLALGGLEVGLRIAGIGYPTSFFLQSRIDGRDFLIPNYRFSYRFFPPAVARVPVLFRMAADKPEGTYRIFLFGESAAFGDPDPSFGMGRYLEALLEERYPSTDFEVICVAMTAINSHAILPIARECARHQGDLWVVYLGNNEMVGPYGPGTVFGSRAPPVGLVRALLALKTTRVGQLLDALITRLQRDVSAPHLWRGIDMFRKHPLRHDDAGRLKGYETFERNLADILRAGTEVRVPILLSTVASNLRDCAPFVSIHAPGLSPAQLREWEGVFQEGLALEAAGLVEAALEAYANAAALDPEFAELHYRMGRCHLAVTNREAALEAFERARNLDALAVRADTRINRILAEAATQFGGEGVTLVDAAQHLVDASSDGIPGQEWFYEHVHFTLAGNYRVARILADAIAQQPPFLNTAQTAASEVEAEACARRLAVTFWDQHRLWKEGAGRISVPPFTSQSSHERSLRHLQARLQEVVSRIDADTPGKDRRVYEEALERAPDDTLLRGNFAQFLEATGSRPEAIAQGQRICELLPDLSWPHYYLGALLVREGRVREAAESFERALAIHRDFRPARDALARLPPRRPS